MPFYSGLECGHQRLREGWLLGLPLLGPQRWMTLGRLVVLSRTEARCLGGRPLFELPTGRFQNLVELENDLGQVRPPFQSLVVLLQHPCLGSVEDLELGSQVPTPR